jgi:DEAD/DEAH box helicase domain-containing protein
VSSKIGALVILRGVLSLPIDLNGLPDSEIPYDPDMDTIVEAPEVPTIGEVALEVYT